MTNSPFFAEVDDQGNVIESENIHKEESRPT